MGDFDGTQLRVREGNEWALSLCSFLCSLSDEGSICESSVYRRLIEDIIHEFVTCVRLFGHFFW